MYFTVSRLKPPNRMAYNSGCRHLHALQRTRFVDSLLRYPRPLVTVSPFSNSKRFYSDDKKITALTVIKDLKHLKSSPTPALVLGLSGLVPFLASPLYMAMTGSFVASLAYSQVAYGAVILSFVGAVRWGRALSEDEVIRPNWFNLGYSVTPSLVAWIALMLPTALSLSTLILGLGGAAYMDITMYGYPSWFKALRFILTMTAILSLWTTLVFKYILSDYAKEARAKKAKEAKQKKEEKEVVKDVVPAADLVLTVVKETVQDPGTDALKTEESKQKLDTETNNSEVTSQENSKELEDKEIQTILYPRI